MQFLRFRFNSKYSFTKLLHSFIVLQQPQADLLLGTLIPTTNMLLAKKMVMRTAD